jgi:uncharacterized protein YcbK (DUF882 family)
MNRTHLARAAIFSLAILISLPLCRGLLAEEIPSSMRGDGEITLYRPVKNERQTFRYRDGKGNYDDGVMADIAHIFRCRLTNEAHAIDTELVEILDAIEDHFGAPEVRLISAYRSPERNAVMRRQGRRVARRSLHMEGRAADIEVPGVSRYGVRDFAYALMRGGVGYYRNRGFIHIDTGDPRTWGFKPAPTRSRTKPATAHK